MTRANRRFPPVAAGFVVAGLVAAGLVAVAASLPFAVPVARAAEPVAAVDLPFAAAVGQRFAIRIVKERERYDGGVLEMKGRSTTPVTAEVIDTIPDGFVYAWVFGKPEIDDPVQAANPLVAQMAGMVEGMRLEFETDAAGRPTRVRNVEKVRDHLRSFAANVTSGVLAMAEREGATADQIAGLRGHLERLTAAYGAMDDDQVGRLFLAEAALLHRITGTRQSADAEHQNVDVLNPFGGPPIGAVVTTRLRETDSGRSEAVIEWEQAYDPETARENLMQVVPELGTLAREAAGRDRGAAAGPPAVTLTETALFTVDTGTGFVRELTYEKLVGIGEKRLIERRLITQKPAT